MTGADPPGLRWLRAVVELADDTLALAHERQATNLVAPVREMGRAMVGQVGVPVIGKRSTGKSTLINALLGHDVTPMEDDVATNIYIRIQAAPEGERPRAIVVFHDPERTAEDVPFEDLGAYATARGSRRHDVQFVEIEHDSPVLDNGLVLFDTPGLGGLDSAHTSATFAALADAAAVVMVVDGRVPVDQGDLAMLGLAAERVRHVIVVANKSDESDDAEAHVSAVQDRPSVGADVRALATSAWLERRALELGDSEEAAVMHELSGVDALRATLAELCDLVIRERYALVLERVATALRELTRPDREQVESVARGEDPSGRIAELNGELERLKRAQTGPRLGMRIGTIRQDVTLEYNAAIARSFAELRHEVERDWSPALSARLGEAGETRVRAAWLAAVNALRDRAAAATADSFRELGLGAGELVLVGDDDDEAESLPDTYARREHVAIPGQSVSGTERTVKRAMRVMLVAGAANLAVPGLGVAILPFALPIGFYLAQREEDEVDRRQNRRAALDYLAANERAAAALSANLSSRATKLSAALARQLDERYLARVETLGATVRALKDAKQGIDEARARLDAAAPLESRCQELARDPMHPGQLGDGAPIAYLASG